MVITQMKLKFSLIKFGIFFLSLGLVSCSNEPEVSIIDMDKGNPSINYLALGDSYTIGQSVAISERWPSQLIQQLELDTFGVEKLDFIAQTGWTTTNLLHAIKNSDLDLTAYNLVSLSIGVNNQYQGKDFSLFETEFELLLNNAIEIAGGKKNVFVVSIPDYGVTPFGSNNSEAIAREIDHYNAYCKQKCEAQNITYIDITPISRQLGDSPGALASDNLHPSGEQYTAWVEEILPAVIPLLYK